MLYRHWQLTGKVFFVFGLAPTFSHTLKELSHRLYLLGVVGAVDKQEYAMNFRLSQIVYTSIVFALVVATAPSAIAQRLVGNVYDDLGEPMEGVTITAENPEARPPRFEATTDSSGSYAIIGMMTGVWTFHAEIEGYNPDETSMRITRAGRNPNLDFQLIRIRTQLELALGDEALAGLNAEQLQTDMAAADAALEASDWDGAIDGYQALLHTLPQLTNLNLPIGAAYQQKGDYESAIASYELMLAAEPDNEQAKAGIARSRLASGDLSAAEALAETASGLNASREDLYNLGELEFAKGENETAKGYYEKASRLAPNWGKPLFKLALVALNGGDMETAKDFFQQVIDVDPSSEEATQSEATLSALP